MNKEVLFIMILDLRQALHIAIHLAEVIHVIDCRHSFLKIIVELLEFGPLPFLTFFYYAVSKLEGKRLFVLGEGRRRSYKVDDIWI